MPNKAWVEGVEVPPHRGAEASSEGEGRGGQGQAQGGPLRRARAVGPLEVQALRRDDRQGLAADRAPARGHVWQSGARHADQRAPAMRGRRDPRRGLRHRDRGLRRGPEHEQQGRRSRGHRARAGGSRRPRIAPPFRSCPATTGSRRSDARRRTPAWRASPATSPRSKAPSTSRSTVPPAPPGSRRSYLHSRPGSAPGARSRAG